MRLTRYMALPTALLIATVSGLQGQQHNVRTMLIARGAPSDFADQVADVVGRAEAEGLPADPIVSKALEGWAKRGRVPLDRILVVITQLEGRLNIGRDVAVRAGLDPPPGAVVAAAANALGRGMHREDVLEIIEAAPSSDAAATGLTVASALGAQGLERAAAVRAVGDAYRGGRSPEEILEFPSVVTGLRARGEPMAGIARRILEGGGLPVPMGQAGGMSGRGGPPGVPGAKPGKAPGPKNKKPGGRSGD